MTPAIKSYVPRGRTLLAIAAVAVAFVFVGVRSWNAQAPFRVVETTIDDVHAAYRSGQLTARQLVQMYLDRIEAFDRQGPRINSVITVNPRALEEAEALDAAFKSSGGFVGPMHGIPLVLKDQVDMAGLPTTYGSIVRKDFVAARDAFVVDKVKKAGGIFIAKVTLGEMGGGDTYGSLFGATRNPYDLLRTPGGSSGGPAAAVAANLATVAIGQEGSASVRRPAAWNSLIGLRPTRGLVSSTRGATGLSPMARTVKDAVTLLDAMVGYDPEDPITAHGVGHVPKTYTEFLNPEGLRGARLGIFSESVGVRSNPNAADHKELLSLFNKTVDELRAAGAEVVPVTIPHVKELMAAVDANAGGRALRFDDEDRDPWANYPNRPYTNEEEMRKAPEYAKVFISPNRPGLYNSAITTVREQLLMTVLKVMADNRLDAIVHRSVEHAPSLIEEGLNPPYKNMDGAIRLNTQLWWASNVTVPAGYTAGGLPVGITFLGRPYAEPVLIKLASGYEQATRHRRPPASTPELAATNTQ